MEELEHPSLHPQVSDTVAFDRAFFQVKPQFSEHKEYLNLELYEQQSMLKTTITLDELKQPFFLKDVKLTGKGTGFFRVWLKTPTGRTFLLLNSNAIKKKVALTGSYSQFFDEKPFVAQITGFAVKDNKANGQGNKENNNNNEKGQETSEENKQKEHDNKGKKDNDDTQTQNRAKFRRKLEKIYGPSWLTPAQKQAMKRATEPEKLFETIKFDNVCITCSLPDGIMETKHDLIIEIDGYLKIKEINYAIEYLGK
ncbi:hypothetical protein HY484_04075 [Candidatus Woesearchaeota archaeon]|nr:hypothetical protein [Candidatus Woesearchaeota archaeon]